MTQDNDDVLAGEVSIRASVDNTGIDVAAKSRAVAAMDRLVGAIADWPAAVFEGKAAKRRIKDRIERQMIEAEGSAILTVGDNRSRVGTSDPINLEAQRRLENRAGVAFETIEELRRLPSPSAEKIDEPGSDQTTAQDINEDWLNAFVRLSEDASSDDLQRLWGRVLSGEIRKPGSFSRRTLRFMADLDLEVAAICEAVAGRVFLNLLLTDSDWNGGIKLQQALALQSIGLVVGVGGLINQSVKLNAKGTVMLFGRKALLQIEGSPEHSVSITALQITQMGQEVFSLLAEPDEVTLLKELAASIDKTNITKLEVCNYERIDAGHVRLMDIQTVYQRLDATAQPSAD